MEEASPKGLKFSLVFTGTFNSLSSLLGPQRTALPSLLLPGPRARKWGSRRRGGADKGAGCCWNPKMDGSGVRTWTLGKGRGQAKRAPRQDGGWPCRALSSGLSLWMGELQVVLRQPNSQWGPTVTPDPWPRLEQVFPLP